MPRKKPVEELTLKQLLGNIGIKNAVLLISILFTIIGTTATVGYQLGTRHFFDSDSNQHVSHTSDSTAKKESINIKSPTVTNTIDSSRDVDNSIVVGDNNSK